MRFDVETIRHDAEVLWALVAEYSPHEAFDAPDAASYVEILNGLERSIKEILERRVCPDGPVKPRAKQVAHALYVVAKSNLGERIMCAAKKADISLLRQAAAHWLFGGSNDELYTKYGPGTLPVRHMLQNVIDVLNGKSAPASVFAEVMVVSLTPDPKIVRKRQTAEREARREHGHLGARQSAPCDVLALV